MITQDSGLCFSLRGALKTSQVSYGPNLKVREGDGVLNFLILSFKAWFWSSLVTNMNLHVHAQQASLLNHTISSDNVEQILCLLCYPVEKKRIRKFYFMSLKCSSKQICITDYWCLSALLQCVHQPERQKIEQLVCFHLTQVGSLSIHLKLSFPDRVVTWKNVVANNDTDDRPSSEPAKPRYTRVSFRGVFWTIQNWP